MYVTGRGVRGFIDFDPRSDGPTSWPVRFFVTLQRSCTEVARSAEYVNPIVKNGTSWPTPYVGLTRGVSFCITLSERRTPTINDQRIRHYKTF